MSDMDISFSDNSKEIPVGVTFTVVVTSPSLDVSGAGAGAAVAGITASPACCRSCVCRRAMRPRWMAWIRAAARSISAISSGVASANMSAMSTGATSPVFTTKRKLITPCSVTSMCDETTSVSLEAVGMGTATATGAGASAAVTTGAASVSMSSSRPLARPKIPFGTKKSSGVLRPGTCMVTLTPSGVTCISEVT